MKKSLFAASAVVLALTGCASIFNGKTQQVTVSSVPEGAMASVTNRAGEKIHSGATPVTLTLDRGAGYFKSESYAIVLTKDGFALKELKLTATLSGWYIGNILLGGLVGMLAVDPLTGAMCTFPSSVSGTLESQATKSSAADGAPTIVSTETLTGEQMKHARLLAPAARAQQ
ncbi:MAG: hypothetical protein ABJA77_14185 [Variovorax sp.]